MVFTYLHLYLQLYLQVAALDSSVGLMAATPYPRRLLL